MKKNFFIIKEITKKANAWKPLLAGFGYQPVSSHPYHVNEIQIPTDEAGTQAICFSYNGTLVGIIRGESVYVMHNDNAIASYPFYVEGCQTLNEAGLTIKKHREMTLGTV